MPSTRTLYSAWSELIFLSVMYKFWEFFSSQLPIHSFMGFHPSLVSGNTLKTIPFTFLVSHSLMLSVFLSLSFLPSTPHFDTLSSLLLHKISNASLALNLNLCLLNEAILHMPSLGSCSLRILESVSR